VAGVHLELSQIARGIIGTVHRCAAMFSKLIAGEPLERFLSLAGQALNALFLINFIGLFIPPGFLNPNWELQTINSAVSLAPMLVTGIGLMGAGRIMQEQPNRLRPLQVYCFVMAGLFALCVPLFIVDSIRVYNETNSQIDQRQNKVIEEIERQQNRLSELTKAGTLPPAFDSAQAKSRIEDARSQTLREADQTRRQTQIGVGRLAVTRLASLLVLIGLLFSLGLLSGLLARGIALDPGLKN